MPYNRPPGERLARMEEKIDSILFRITSSEGHYEAHEKRIRGLEGNNSRLIGMGAVAALGATILGSNLASWIHTLN